MAKGKKTGGRKAGVPNKITFQVVEILQALEFEPIAEAVKGLVAIQFDRPDVFLRGCLGLAEFIYPKRKAVEHSGEIANPYLDKSYEELKELAREILKDDK